VSIFLLFIFKNDIISAERGLMIVALFGVTGVGKSFYKNAICNRLNFKKLTTIRTREPREGEINGVTGLFMTPAELDELDNKGDIFYRFGVFDGQYAYLRNEVESPENKVFEMHYTQLDDWKRLCNDLVSIYILPKSLDDAKERIYERHLSKDKEEVRLKEIEEQYNAVVKNENMMNKFDYVFTNNYDQDSEDRMIELIQTIMNSENN
jgi:guanylate kinase